MSKTTAGPAPGEVLTKRQTITVMVGLMLGMFLSSLDQTIVSTSIYTIANDLDGLSLQAWATTAYLITSTVSTRSAPTEPNIFATTFAVIGTRAERGRRSWRA